MIAHNLPSGFNIKKVMATLSGTYHAFPLQQGISTSYRAELKVEHFVDAEIRLQNGV